MGAKVLVVEDEESLRYTFESFLRDEGYAVIAVASLREALTQMTRDSFDLIIADVILRDGSGFDVLQEVRRCNLRSLVILSSGFRNPEAALMAFRLGAFDYFQKPVRQQALVNATQKALARTRRADDEEAGRSNLGPILLGLDDGIIILDKAMRVLELNDAAAKQCSLSHDIIGKTLDPRRDQCGASCLNCLRKVLADEEETPRWCTCGETCTNRELVSVAAFPFLDVAGRSAGFVLTLRAQPHWLGG